MNGRAAVSAVAALLLAATVAGCSPTGETSTITLEHPRPVSSIDADLPVADTVDPILQPAVYPIAASLRTLVADNRLSPLSASRVYAFTLLAAARAFQSAPDRQENAAAATAAAVTATRIWVHNPTALQEVATWPRQYRSLTEETTRQATLIGEQVADQADVGYADSLEPEPDLPVDDMWDWQPTGKAHTAFEQPRWGQMTPIADTASCDIPPPDLTVLQSQLQQMQATFDPHQHASPTVLTWLGGPGSATPPGQWLQMAETAGRAANLNAAEATQLMAAAAIAGYDAGILVWREKKEHHVARPETVIAKLTGEEPQMIRETPPHPSYPSGHAGFSGAGASVIEQVLGNVPVTLVLPPDNGVAAESHTYDTPELAAREAVQSRVLAGFHYPEDGTQGLTLGRCVGAAAVAYVRALP